MSEPFEVAIAHPHLDSVGALLDEPLGAARASAILLAHGAGIDMQHPWMASLAAALAARGFRVMRFRYPYMERASREGKPMPPDRTAVLEDAHAAVFEAFARRTRARRRLLAGKSLGGRIATHLAAKGCDAHGLVVLGFPLHPPRAPEKQRSEHFPAIVQPGLFLHGTRDEFATPDEMRAALTRYAGRSTLSIVEGGNHSFELPAARRVALPEVLADLAGRIAEWDESTWPE